MSTRSCRPRWPDGCVDAASTLANVADVDLAGAGDSEIARYAEHNQLIIISKDADFAMLRSPDRFGLIWLRCGNITTPKLVSWLQPRWSAIVDALNNGERSIEVR